MNQQRTQKQIDTLIGMVKSDADVIAVMLFGSVARGEAAPDSDVDVCLVLKPGRYEQVFLSDKKLHYLGRSALDVHVYQQLPIYIRHRILKEGKTLYCRDEDGLYDVAFRTIDEFSDFEPFYHEYLQRVLDDR